jgi:hypothetical protein
MKRLLILLALPALLLYADATKETFVRVKMFGGMATTEVTAKTEYRPTMKAEANTTKLIALVSPKPQHLGEITRLDKELIWQLNHDNKTYAEGPLKLPEAKTKAETKTEGSGSTDTAQKYRIVSSEFSVKKLDSTKTINGFTCAGYLATWTLVVEEIATKNRSTTTMYLKEWTTPETDVIKQAEAQEAAYNKAYLAKLGVTVSPGQSSMMGMEYLMTLGMKPEDVAAHWKGYSAELAKIQGYAIISDLKWTVVDSAKSKASTPEREPERGAFGMPNLSGIISNKIADKLTSPEPNTVFAAYTEIKSISVSALPDKDFEVPENYKKIEGK